MVDPDPPFQHVTGNGVRLFQRVHAEGTALVFVKLGDLLLILHGQHVAHGRLPSHTHPRLVRRTNQAHVETGTTAHGGDVDDLDPITVQVIPHETGKQVLKGMDASLGEDLLVGHTETQIEHGNGVLVRGLHGLGHAYRRGFHTGVVNGKTVQ